MQLLIQYIVIWHQIHTLLSTEAITVCHVGIYAAEERKGWFMVALKQATNNPRDAASILWLEDLHSKLVIELYILLGFKLYEPLGTSFYSRQSYGGCKNPQLETYHKQSSSQWGLEYNGVQDSIIADSDPERVTSLHYLHSTPPSTHSSLYPSIYLHLISTLSKQQGVCQRLWSCVCMHVRPAVVCRGRLLPAKSCYWLDACPSEP